MNPKIPDPHPAELALLGAIAAGEGVRNYLEIGAREGESLEVMGAMLMPGHHLAAVELPAGPWGRVDSHKALERVARQTGATILWGDSRDDATVARAAKLGPFDLVFIDGDHSYGSAMQDWLNYGPLGAIVAFDDIWATWPAYRPGPYVGDLWREIKGDFRHVELAGNRERSQGIGILWR